MSVHACACVQYYIASMLPDSQSEKRHFFVKSLKDFIQFIYTHCADGLAWDWVNHMLYWTDAGDRDIEVYDAIGGYRKKLIQSGPNAKPRAIVVDPANK